MAKINIVDNVKNQADKVAENYKKRKQDRKEQRLERELARAKAKEQELREQEEKVKKERDRLMSMDSNELLVEAILAIRGFYNEFIDVLERLDTVESDITELESELSAIRAGLPSDEENEY